MRKILFALLMAILLYGMTGCSEFNGAKTDNETKSVQGKLFVNGKEVNANTQLYGDFAEIPFVEVLKALGGTIDWINDSEARIVMQDKQFLLDLENLSFKNEKNTINLLIPSPGGSILSCKAQSKELILDNITLKSVMHLMGIFVDIRYSIAEAAVYVTKKTD